MRSVKPGRGPSLQGAIGSIFAVVFGIFWMVSAAKMGAPTPFVLMGLVFVVIAGSNVIVSLMNATGENRFSLYDITEEGEEPDPLEEVLNKKRKNNRAKRGRRETNRNGFLSLLWGKSGERLRFLPFLWEKVVRKNGVFYRFFRGCTCIHCVFCL